MKNLSFKLLLFCLGCSSEQKSIQPSALHTDTLGYAITATANEEAIENGLQLLREGGTAMDAALAVALSQITSTGGKFISFAGVLNLVYYEAETGKIYNMNGSFNTLSNESDPLSIPKKDFSVSSKTDGRSVLVPGFMKGVGAAHEKFGKLPFERIFKHSIQIARNGVRWTNVDSANFAMFKHLLLRYPDAKNIFTKGDGSYYRVGDIFKQPQLAETLIEVSKQGADYMYKGEWAKKFVPTVAALGGKITQEDLDKYSVIWSEPVHGSYHGYDLYVHGAPSIGGASLIEALNLAEASELASQGHYSKSATALYDLYRICDASEYYNNTSFENRIDKKKANEKWKKIISNKQDFEIKQEKYRNDHSANIIATDRWGNMVALIHSINTNAWGSNGIFIDGVSIPDAASSWQEEIMRAGPGQRLTENTNPGFVFKNGKPFMAFSCIGNGLNNQTLAGLVNVLDFEMTPEEAIKMPTIGFAFLENNKSVLCIEPGKFSKDVINEAEKLGARFEEHPAAVAGFWSAILRDPKTGKVFATPVLYK